MKAEQIPTGARILAVVDYYDELTSERPYHEAMPPEEALAVLQREAGRALDPLWCRGSDEGEWKRQTPWPSDRSHAAAVVARADQRARSCRAASSRKAPRPIRYSTISRSRTARFTRSTKSPDDGHEPWRRRYDGAHRVEADRASSRSRPSACLRSTKPRDLACRFATGVEAEAIAA